MDAADRLLEAYRRSTPHNVKDEYAAEVLIKKTDRAILNNNHLNSLNYWATKGLDDQFSSSKPKPGTEELDHIHSVLCKTYQYI